MLALIGLIPLLPLVGFVVCGLFGKRLPKTAVSAIACGSVLLAFLVSIGAILELRRQPVPERWGFGGRSFEKTYWVWIPEMPFAGQSASAPKEGSGASPVATPHAPGTDASSTPETARGSSGVSETGAGVPVTGGPFAPVSDRDRGGSSNRPFWVEMGFRLDALSAIMLLVVTGVGFLIHVYSTGYMAHDPGYARYFAFLNLFMAMMLTLVLAKNFLVMFVGWEGVGLCSYLLIGFWFEDPEKAQAGRKAFIVNRIGDFAFIIAMLAILDRFHSLHFAEVMATIERGGVPTAFLTFVGLALFIGAVGKSAQIPLYVWLPDAMAGPTPVSALIHAATMVTAGVYMVARCSALYLHAPAALAVVAIVGASTALFAATIGLVQNDIKKVLAYSTVSQLGYMFLGAGVGAFSAGIFHLMTHAFFKALLFLGAGSVIHAMGGEQDMRRMGGLKDKLPWTWRTMLVGALAIAGIPILSGFFSKDEILWRAWEGGHPLLWAIGAAAAGLTAFYMFRLIYLTFLGSFRGTGEQAHHLHESPSSMVAPLVVLAALAIVGGWVGIPRALGGLAGIPNWFEETLAPVLGTAPGEPGAGTSGAVVSHASAGLAAVTRPGSPRGIEGHAEGSGGAAEYLLMLLAVAIAVSGILIARRFYLGPGALPERAARSVGPLYELILNKYWVDELYGATVLRLYDATCVLFDSFDRWVVDGLVNAAAAFTEMIGQILRLFQTGFVRNYALFLFAGAVLLVWILGR